MPKVFIGVGSNLGDREGYFRSAKAALSAHPGVHDLRLSPVYETEPVETDLGPRETLVMLQELEKNAGRVRGSKNEPRTLDLDLLFYDAQVINETGLQVPHPRLEERAFVLAPFCDLAPEWVHSALKKTMKELSNNLSAMLNERPFVVRCPGNNDEDHSRS
jgi:2-amino-4-hydroxy-6-hydroxymethyldihydropteridine diphosphokinase